MGNDAPTLAKLFRMCRVGIGQRIESFDPDRLHIALHAKVR